jgi:hypothetical protein
VLLPVCCLHHLFDARPLGLTQQCHQKLHACDTRIINSLRVSRALEVTNR